MLPKVKPVCELEFVLTVSSEVLGEVYIYIYCTCTRPHPPDTETYTHHIMPLMCHDSKRQGQATANAVATSLATRSPAAIAPSTWPFEASVSVPAK